MTYRRPLLELGEYLDESGAPIPYGRRWGMDSPPDDTYSVSQHPERFAPLLEVGRALREHLITTYNVKVDGELIVPRDPNAAPLRIAERDYPMVTVAAGIAGDERFPQCGCDACDEGVEELADQLEDLVLAVARGEYSERWVRRGLETSWVTRDGRRGQWGKEFDNEHRAALKARGKHAEYVPWPLRT